MGNPIIDAIQQVTKNEGTLSGGGIIHFVGGSQRAQQAASHMFGDFEAVKDMGKFAAKAAGVALAAGAVAHIPGAELAAPAGLAGMMGAMANRLGGFTRGK